MRKYNASIVRLLAAILVWVSIFTTGFMPGRTAFASSAAENVFASTGVTASAYGSSSTAYGPAKAIDGDTTVTKWVYTGGSSLPESNNPYWLQVDAGTAATVQQFVIAHAGSGGEAASYNTRDFTIETSNDNVNWTPVVTVTGNTYSVTTHNLAAPVTARYFKLDITNPGGPNPATGLYSAIIYDFQANGSPAMMAAQATGGNQGLLAEYYTGNSDFSFGTLKATTVDAQVNFTDLNPILTRWTGSEDHANVRWTGQIVAPSTDSYTFHMIGDNGFRLWIDDKLTIDHWASDWDKEQVSTPVSLIGGKKYTFKIEYFEDYGGSNLYLRWSTPTMAKTLVPASVFFLPQAYTGPAAGSAAQDGYTISLSMQSALGTLPASLDTHLTVTADEVAVPLQSVAIGSDASTLTLKTSAAIKPGQKVKVAYDGQASLQYAAGTAIGSFTFNPSNLSEYVNYGPIAIAMSFYGNPKTNRSFAWYTNYQLPDNAPPHAKDSIVEIVPADQDFTSGAKLRYVGKPEDTKILPSLSITSTTKGAFISHKVIADGLTPGTTYKYRVGSDDNWSAPGSFTTEAENENNYEFLYMTDSQGANSNDYSVFANTMKQGLEHYPNSKFLIMTGDQVDAGSLENQWLDYFGKPQDMFLKLPIMAAVGNHEGPYNDNYYYHFNYPNDSIANPLPPGSVYSFDYGDAHIMVLNTMDITWDSRQSESFRQQVEWLKKEVAETDKKWKVVAFHKAIYSLGNHAVDRDILSNRKLLYPVFDELGIDVVLQGHDHTFMRSYQMYNDKPVPDANIQKDGNGNPLNPDGTLYMINNSAGTKYYNLQNGVDRYYAAVFQQPYQPIYSGVKMTESSFTIESYKSGEEKPFDTYTIVRDDSMPNPVEQLVLNKNADGKSVLTWSKPSHVNAADPIRGYRIYEINGKLGMNWSAYVPADSSTDQYQYVVDDSKADGIYTFAVKSVDKRDNSAASTVSSVPNVPSAPNVDDGHNLFGWTNVPGFAQLSDYEYSVDGGTSWQPVTANPQPVGDNEYAAGAVMVRVKANAVAGVPAGTPLASDKPFTVNIALNTFRAIAELKRGDQLLVNLTLEPIAEYSGGAYAVFELLDGDNPILINAVPVQQNKLSVTQYFNVSGTQYKVKVFVIDQFNSDLTVPAQLAKPVVLQ